MTRVRDIIRVWSPVSPHQARWQEMESVALQVAERHALTLENVTGRAMWHAAVNARRELCWRLRQRGYSYGKIAEFLDRDQSSVRAAVHRHAREIGFPMNRPVSTAAGPLIGSTVAV